MANKKTGYADYLKRGMEHRLRLLMSAEQLPDNVDAPVLWQCLVTGKIFDASYHHLGNQTAAGKHASTGQTFWEEWRPKYEDLAEEYGMELVYEPTRDFAPGDTRQPVIWYVPEEGRYFTASYAQLAYGKPNRFMKKKKEIVHG